MSSKDGKVFGIDLGTTNSAIAVYKDDEAHIIKNMEGSDTTPSVVYFVGQSADGGDESLVGAQAKNSAAMDPDNVVQFIKRYMGDRTVDFKVQGPSGKEYTPEMISALILKKVCKDAEQREDTGAVKDVVITVPAYFDDAARIATKQAGKIAGLNVLRVINEPTAAAIAFGIDSSKEGKVLVYDLGGGTFDVTIMDINKGNYDVIATDGDHKLGGINFDQQIIKLIIRKLEENECAVDDEDDALMADIREKAEKMKIALSSVETTRLPFTVNGKSPKISITREEFETEAQSLMQRTQFLVEEVMSAANLTWADIDHLLIVGGSTKMPMVKKMLKEVSGKEVTFKADPDLAVAQGAAIFASTLDKDNPNSTGAGAGADSSEGSSRASITVSDVTSQSLGVITLESEFTNRKVNTIIIPHNTKIPTKQSVEVRTVYDQQTRILVEVTEGNDEEVEYVKVIGSKSLTIPAYPKGSPVEIIYAYDPDQTIYIEVIDKVTNQSLGTFQIDRTSNLSDDQVKDAISVVGKTTVE